MTMTFVAVPPAPASPEDTAVVADGWYPAIDCNEMRAALRIGEVVTHDRLFAAIQSGMIAVIDELRVWRAVQDAAGHASMAAVAPDENIGGQPRLVLLFTRAVRFAAASELVELHRDISATNDGLNRAESQLQTAADYRRMMTWAVRDILGVSRTAVELI